MATNKKWLYFSIIKEYSYKYSMHGNDVFSTKHWHKFEKFGFNYDIFVCSNIPNEEFRFGKPNTDLNGYLMNPSHSLLGVFTIINSSNESEARRLGQSIVENFINVLSVSSKIGFEIALNQIFITQLSEKDFDSGNFHFETKYGNDTISFRFKTHYETHYFNYRLSCYKNEDNLLPVTCVMPRTGLNIEATLLKLDEFNENSVKLLNSYKKLKPEDRYLFNISSKLFRQSILTEDLTISFLLLWMGLETISERNYSPLLDEETVDDILKMLETRYKKEIPRIKSQLKNIHKKGNTRLLSEFVSANSEFKLDDVKDTINELKGLRGQIVHPKNTVDNQKLFEYHKNLFNILESLLRTILNNGEIKQNE